MARLLRDARQPGDDRGEALEVESGLVRDVGVRVERDVGDRVALGDQEAPALEVALERRKRRIAAAALRLELVWRGGDVPDVEPEAKNRDVRLVAVLLEELPLQHLCSFEPVVRQVGSALGEMEGDRVRLAERAPVVEDERRNPQARVESTEDLRSVRAVDHVELTALVVNTEVGEQEPDLVAVAGDLGVVEEHRRNDGRSARSGGGVGGRASSGPV